MAVLCVIAKPETIQMSINGILLSDKVDGPLMHITIINLKILAWEQEARRGDRKEFQRGMRKLGE